MGVEKMTWEKFLSDPRVIDDLMYVSRYAGTRETVEDIWENGIINKDQLYHRYAPCGNEWILEAWDRNLDRGKIKGIEQE